MHEARWIKHISLMMCFTRSKDKGDHMGLTRQEFEYQKQFPQKTIYKYGTYRDTRYMTEEEKEALLHPAEEGEEYDPTQPMELNFSDEEQAMLQELCADLAEEAEEKDPSLLEAEAIAARVQAQAESRIQDNVTALIQNIQNEQ